VRIRTLCIAACALPLAANVSCGSDSPPACKDVPACTAQATVFAATTQACGATGDCTAQPAGSCRKPIVPSSGVTEIALGTQVVGSVVTFDVPAGTASISIIEQANGTGPAAPPDTVTLNGNAVIENTAVPDKLKNPGGTVIYDDNPPSPPPPDPSGETVFFASGSPVTGAFTIPNTSKLLAQSVNVANEQEVGAAMTEIKGDTMTAVFAKPGNERPTEFKTKEGSDQSVIRYVRMKK